MTKSKHREEAGESRLVEDVKTAFHEVDELRSREREAMAICGEGDKVGGCDNQVSILEGFRCADCLAWFHRDCINEHFELDAYVKKLRELREQGAIDDWKKEIATTQATLVARDTEIREVLEGLRPLFSECWCSALSGHTDACLATRVLWDKVKND